MGRNPFNPRDRFDEGIWGPESLWGSNPRSGPEEQQTTRRETFIRLLLDLLERIQRPFKGKERE